MVKTLFAFLCGVWVTACGYCFCETELRGRPGDQVVAELLDRTPFVDREALREWRAARRGEAEAPREWLRERLQEDSGPSMPWASTDPFGWLADPRLSGLGTVAGLISFAFAFTSPRSRV